MHALTGIRLFASNSGHLFQIENNPVVGDIAAILFNPGVTGHDQQLLFNIIVNVPGFSAERGFFATAFFGMFDVNRCAAHFDMLVDHVIVCCQCVSIGVISLLILMPELDRISFETKQSLFDPVGDNRGFPLNVATAPCLLKDNGIACCGDQAVVLLVTCELQLIAEKRDLPLC